MFRIPLHQQFFAGAGGLQQPDNDPQKIRETRQTRRRSNRASSQKFGRLIAHFEMECGARPEVAPHPLQHISETNLAGWGLATEVRAFGIRVGIRGIEALHKIARLACRLSRASLCRFEFPQYILARSNRIF